MWLQSAIVEFRALHPRYGTPSGADDKCRKASGEFCDLVLALRPKARVMVSDEVAIVYGVAHRAAEVDSWIVDWTARQYFKSAEFPVVERANRF
jgi:hypothetical protein